MKAIKPEDVSASNVSSDTSKKSKGKSRVLDVEE